MMKLKGRIRVKLSRLRAPEELAKLTITLAIVVSIIVALAIVYVNLTDIAIVMVNGDVILKGKVSSNEVLYAYVIRESARPLISYIDPSLPLIKYPLIALDDEATVIDAIPLVTCETYTRLIKNEVIATYMCNGKSFMKVVSPQLSTISLIGGNVTSISLEFFPNHLLSYDFDSTTLRMKALLPFLNMSYTLSLKLKGCSIMNVKATPWSKLIIYTQPTANSCKIELRNLSLCFEGITEYMEKSCQPSPLFVRFLAYSMNGLMNVIAIIIMPLIAVITWRKIRNELRTPRGFFVFVILMSFMGSITALHWDAIMSYYFAKYSFDPISLYKWTYSNQLMAKVKLPSHYPMFAGYTYITPWIAILLFPLSFIQSLFNPTGFLYTLTPDALTLGMYSLWTFKLNHLIYYFTLGLWFGIFLYATYLIAKRIFEEEKVLMFMYSPFTVLITFYWKMFEPMLLLFLVLVIYMVSKSKKHYLISGFFGGIVTTKVYGTIYLLPFIKYISKRKLVLALLGILISYIPSLIIVKSLGLDKFIFITLYYQSHREIAAVNYFPLILGEPIKIITSFGNLAMVIEIFLFVLVFALFLKYGRIRSIRDHLIWSIAMIVPYMIFNKIVSPQNYLFMLFSLYVLGLTELANLLSITLTLYVISVFPTVFYFALSGMTYLGKYYFYAKGSVFSVIAYLFEAFVRPIAWSFLVAMIIVINGIALMRVLEEALTEK
ncbi:hypothetical protein EYM_04100 [Ignicoccus islandicus DSM 13165]|uniref:Uncharacterized protein n=1 Tax=Ignicoccus islandicus DSM 13165 TaxID=940295 RepID=A0A0U2WND6_9CREN|nr:hypothetical protein [Ignicoccus islandicus]ALU12465.1 hypothetical protein EYM_04100 [Ignicoccus islandicus DSM 13165]